MVYYAGSPANDTFNINGAADGFGVTNEKLTTLLGAPTLALSSFV